ncbi:hypothetical protein LB503_012631 [Fusarium chuoi]|nr:hypothetical protein LB503_012631 [Fusarium chuoi]
MASEAKQRDHDLLSFMSTFLITHQRLDLSLTLLSVLIDDASIDVQVRSNKGVCLARSKDLLEARFLNRNDDLLPEATNLPELVAVKIPRPDGDLNSICWKSVKDGVLMPSFVLEAAEIDLEKFLDNPKAVEYRKVLGLAVDIATGVRALHDVGIIHGDIKPANVLIFKDPQLTLLTLDHLCFDQTSNLPRSSLLAQDFGKHLNVETIWTVTNLPKRMYTLSAWFYGD